MDPCSILFFAIVLIKDEIIGYAASEQFISKARNATPRQLRMPRKYTHYSQKKTGSIHFYQESLQSRTYENLTGLLSIPNSTQSNAEIGTTKLVCGRYVHEGYRARSNALKLTTVILEFAQQFSSSVSFFTNKLAPAVSNRVLLKQAQIR